MLSPHIRKQVDRLWDRFWSAGLTNPLVAIEQITYLLFLNRLEAVDAERQRKGKPSIYKRSKAHPDADRCRWSYIRREKTNPHHLIKVVFPWLRELDKTLADEKPQKGALGTLESRMSDA